MSTLTIAGLFVFGLVIAPMVAEVWQRMSPKGRLLVIAVAVLAFMMLACGPTPMLRAVAQICNERRVPCQIALEETMACGFGVCLGCVVEKREPEGDFDRFVRVCSEGPVFDAREVIP